MSSYMQKPEQVERKWYIIDAEGKTLGRLATEVSKILMGKHKPTYTPNCDMGDFVIVINTDKIVLTGKKLDKKLYRYHTGHIGGLKEVTYKTLIEKKSDLAVYEAIKGMLPKNTLGRAMATHCHIYKGAEHNNQAQKPEVWNGGNL